MVLCLWELNYGCAKKLYECITHRMYMYIYMCTYHTISTQVVVLIGWIEIAHFPDKYSGIFCTTSKTSDLSMQMYYMYVYQVYTCTLYMFLRDYGSLHTCTHTHTHTHHTLLHLRCTLYVPNMYMYTVFGLCTLCRCPVIQIILL